MVDQGAGDSTQNKDAPAPLKRHEPNDLGSLIQIWIIQSIYTTVVIFFSGHGGYGGGGGGYGGHGGGGYRGHGGYGGGGRYGGHGGYGGGGRYGGHRGRWC